MKFIDYDDRLANKVYKHFMNKYGDKFGKSNAWGYAAEALVRQYYGHPVDDNWYKCEEGNGWDYVDNEGYKIDVKNCRCSYYYFSTIDNMWIIHDYKGLNADCYLCTCMDPFTKKIALIGWITPEELKAKCTHLRHKELTPKGWEMNGSGYIVRLDDLHLIHPVKQENT